jgi:flagellar basal body rod protein FlgC
VASANIANAGTSAKPEDAELDAVAAGRQTGRHDRQPDSGGYVPVSVEHQGLEGGGVRASIGALAPSHLLATEVGMGPGDGGDRARTEDDIERELVAVMHARRAYESSLKVIEAEDEMMGGLLDDPI